MVGNYIFENIYEHKLSTMYLAISNIKSIEYKSKGHLVQNLKVRFKI